MSVRNTTDLSRQAHPGDDDFGDELLPAEDWPTYSTPVPVWVLLSGCSAQAYRMYAFLAEHINNREPGQRISCPKQDAIALVLGLSDGRRVAPYRKELEKLGAIEVTQYRYAGGMRRGYRYKVRFNPPPGYSGLLALTQFYKANPQVRSAEQEGRTAAAKAPQRDESAGQHGGAKNRTTGGAKNRTTRGTRDRTVHGAKHAAPELDQENSDQENGFSLSSDVTSPSTYTGDDERETTATGSKNQTSTEAVPQQRSADVGGIEAVGQAYADAATAGGWVASPTVLAAVRADAAMLIGEGYPAAWLVDRAAEMPARRWSSLRTHAERSPVPARFATAQAPAPAPAERCPECRGSGWIEDEHGDPIGKCNHPKIRAGAS